MPTLEDFVEAVARDGRGRAVAIAATSHADANGRITAVARRSPKAVLLARAPIFEPSVEPLVHALRTGGALGALLDPLLEPVSRFLLGPDHAAIAAILVPDALDERPALAGRMLVTRFAPALAAQLSVPEPLVAALLAERTGEPGSLARVARALGFVPTLQALGALARSAGLALLLPAESLLDEVKGAAGVVLAVTGVEPSLPVADTYQDDLAHETKQPDDHPGCVLALRGAIKARVKGAVEVRLRRVRARRPKPKPVHPAKLLPKAQRLPAPPAPERLNAEAPPPPVPARPRTTSTRVVKAASSSRPGVAEPARPVNRARLLRAGGVAAFFVSALGIFAVYEAIPERRDPSALRKSVAELPRAESGEPESRSTAPGLPAADRSGMSHPDSSSSSSDRGATSKPSPKSLPDAPRPKTPAPGSPPALASARHGSAQPPTVRPAIEHIREIDQATGTGRPEDVVRRIESLLDGTVQTSDALVRHRPGLIQRLGLLIRCDRAADCLARFAGDSRASTADRLLAIEALLQQGCLPMRVRNAVESIARNDRDPQIRERALAALGGRS